MIKTGLHEFEAGFFPFVSQLEVCKFFLGGVNFRGQLAKNWHRGVELLCS